MLGCFSNENLTMCNVSAHAKIVWETICIEFPLGILACDNKLFVTRATDVSLLNRTIRYTRVTVLFTDICMYIDVFCK